MYLNVNTEFLKTFHRNYSSALKIVHVFEQRRVFLEKRSYFFTSFLKRHFSFFLFKPLILRQDRVKN